MTLELRAEDGDSILNSGKRAFPGGPVGKTLCSQCGGPGSIPGRGTRSHMHATTNSPHAATNSPHAATKISPAATKTPGAA